MATRTTMHNWFLVAAGVACAACGGKAPAESPDDVTCPEGQRYDGQYCRVVEPSPGEGSEQDPATEQASQAPQADEPKQPETEPPQTSDEQEAPTNGALEDDSAKDTGDFEELEPEQATPVDVTMAAQAGPLVQYMAQSHLPPGARPFGAPFAGQFAEGQVLEQKVQLSHEQCYTVIAAGLPPVSEVNVSLYGESYPEDRTGAAALASDDTSGSQAVLGSGKDCYRPARSGPAWLVVKVDKGRGVAAAQVFAK